jgi:hypothetical protein
VVIGHEYSQMLLQFRQLLPRCPFLLENRSGSSYQGLIEKGQAKDEARCAGGAFPGKLG